MKRILILAAACAAAVVGAAEDSSQRDAKLDKERTLQTLARLDLHARGDMFNRCYCIYFADEATAVVKRVVYKCPEFGISQTRLPYFHRRYPAGAKGPFEVQAVVEAKDGTRVKKTITVPFREKPLKKPLPNDKVLLGVVSYGPGLERYEMVTNGLGNLYVRWNAWKQLLPENAGEEWMEEAEKRGIHCMTIYSNTPRDAREQIKKAWGRRYLGNNIGERTGFLYGSRQEMKGPQDRNLTEAREWFMSRFLRGDREMTRGEEGEDPRMFATSGAAFANHELPAGVDFVCNEMYAVGCFNLTYATAEARGAARKWGPEWWSAWLAHEWQSFGIPYQSDDKYLSLEAGIKALWVMGTSLMCLESGSSGTQAHPHTWDADRAGYKYDDDPPRRYREAIRKCNEFMREHPRAKGTPETKIALALGLNDGYMGQNRNDVAPWGQHANRVAHAGEKVNPWACSHPEFTWDRMRELFFPGARGTHGLSGTPYGQVDVVGVDDETRLKDIERYSLIVFGGWNTMTPRAAKLLEKWMEAGGVCAMCLPQLTKRDDRSFLDYDAGDLLMPFGMKIAGFEEANGIRVAALKPDPKIEVAETTGKGGRPLVVKRKVGKGEFHLLLAYEFPGGNRPLGERWKKHVASLAAAVPQTVALSQIEKADELRFFTAAAYKSAVYVMNLDIHNARKVRATVLGKPRDLSLAPLEIAEIPIR